MKTTSALLGAVALLGVSSLAHAAGGLAVQWAEGETRTYSLQSRTLLPAQMRLQAAENLDARVDQMWLDVVTTCGIEELIGKKRINLVCTLDDVQVRGMAVPSDLKRAPKIIAEMDASLTGAKVQLQYLRDGRLRGLDLEGVDKSTPRLEEQHEVLRLLLLRTFAALDVGMPKKGDDRGGSWETRESFALALPVQAGTLGNYKLIWTATGAEGGIVDLSATAKGIITGGQMVPSGQGEEPAIQVRVELDGKARFNTQTGVLLEHSYTVEGQHTASSIMAEQGRSLPYVHSASALFLPPGEAPPALGASGLLNEVLQPAKAAAEE